jgi:hypothetical protein
MAALIVRLAGDAVGRRYSIDLLSSQRGYRLDTPLVIITHGTSTYAHPCVSNIVGEEEGGGGTNHPQWYIHTLASLGSASTFSQRTSRYLSRSPLGGAVLEERERERLKSRRWSTPQRFMMIQLALVTASPIRGPSRGPEIDRPVGGDLIRAALPT